jgi:hypothetical protein
MPSIINATTSTGLVSSADNSGSLQLATNNGTTAVTIDTSQNVGIGKTNPNAKLDVAGVSQVSSGGVELQLQVSGTDGFINMNGGGDLSFRLGSGYTQVMRLISGGNFQMNSGYGSIATAYGCRAWVNFNGQGTPAIRASGNVSSITDNSTGNYTINFATAMPDANYSAVGSVFDNGATCFASFATSSVQIYTRLIQTGSFPTGAVDDFSVVSAAIFR